MTPMLRRWNKHRRTKPGCNNTAAHSAPAPSACSPPGNHAVGHLEEKPPDTPKHLNMSMRPRWPRRAGSNYLPTAKQIFAHNSSEYIQFDDPETLINAVREVYEQTKNP